MMTLTVYLVKVRMSFFVVQKRKLHILKQTKPETEAEQRACI